MEWKKRNRLEHAKQKIRESDESDNEGGKKRGKRRSKKNGGVIVRIVYLDWKLSEKLWHETSIHSE